MRGFNELKKETLELLKERECLTSLEVANELAISVDNSQMVLLRACRQGLVSRIPLPRIEKRGRAAYVYSITDRGRSRLEYYEEKG